MHPSPIRKGPELRTDRLRLRRWQPSDLPAFTAMNADPAVMEHFVTPLGEEEARAYLDQLERHFDEHAFGMWAVEVPGSDPFVGYVGLESVAADLPFAPAVEIGWRLARRAWGKGYATEAAKACLGYGFGELGLNEIVATTVPANRRSWQVMERIGMRRDVTAGFEHPRVPKGHRLRHHVLYRLDAATWRARGSH